MSRRDSQKEKDTDTKRRAETYKQTDRQTERQTDTDTDRHGDRQTDRQRHTYIHTYIPTYRHRQTGNNADRVTARGTYENYEQLWIGVESCKVWASRGSLVISYRTSTEM